ncbi:MAG TPA: STAS domain-containing protein [Acidimicrobiales bacterium]|nr:STAS domain-containing protein [Acidimicrobiales bacterium]
MSTTHSGQVLVVTLTEIDVANAEVFRSELATAVNRYLDTPNADGAPLSIDLAAVRFLDSTALGAILDADRAVRAAGRRLDLVGVQTTVRRVFEVTGVWDHLHATRPSGHLPWHRGLR